jgi:hypothetical protein
MFSPHMGHSFDAIDFSQDDPYGTSSSMGGNTLGPFRGGLVAAVAGDARQEGANCFADEVVVDFPSVAPAVDRMRRAFLLDEHPRPLSAGIRLTTRDALEGTTVPLSVPVRRTCRACGGRGESWTECCARCAGTGTEFVRHSLQVTVPAGVVDGMTVHFALTTPQNAPTRIELRIAVA